MNTVECYEDYPWWVIVLSNAFSLTLYGLGAFVVYQIGWIWMAVYLLFILSLEIRLLRWSCVNCYYYGKACAFGKGKLSGLLFRRGDPESFSRRKVSWLEMVPDILVPLIPLVTGIVVLIRDFSWQILIAVTAIVLLASAGNGFIRGSLACRHCRQRELGCPAEQLFNKARET